MCYSMLFVHLYVVIHKACVGATPAKELYRFQKKKGDLEWTLLVQETDTPLQSTATADMT